MLPNRVHRRIVLRNYKKPIYKANSPTALLTAFKACIKGHKSLYRAGFLYKNILINNFLITESKNSPFYLTFLIDLNLTIVNDRIKLLKAKGKTGIRAFIAIGIFLNKQHFFMYDLKSFFWMLF